jgi:hypothetical protein
MDMHDRREHSVSMYASAKDARIAELEAEIDAERKRRWDGNRMASDEQRQEVLALKAERDRLRGLCNWASGRLLDTGDVAGHEKILAALQEGE